MKLTFIATIHLPVDLPKGLSGIKQDLVYKPVTDTCTVRQWCLTDEKLLDSLSKKGLTLPIILTNNFLFLLEKKVKNYSEQKFL